MQIDQPHTIEYRHLSQPEEIEATYELMRQLRPGLSSASEYVQKVQMQMKEGYKLMVFKKNGQALGLVGFRINSNLVYGKYLYVDDLVTDSVFRSHGLGDIMLKQMMSVAMENDCDRLVLDTGVTNSRAQKFYYKFGMLFTAMKFTWALKK